MVDFFVREPEFKQLVEEQLRLVGDLERIISKVAVGRVNPRELVQLRTALQAIEPVKRACEKAKNDSLRRIGEQLNVCEVMRDRIAREINPDPPVLLNKGGVIADGVSQELDDLRSKLTKLDQKRTDAEKELAARKAEVDNLSAFLQ